MQKTEMKYRKKGQFAGGAVSAIVTLIVGVGVATLLMIFVGSLGGQTYEQVESDIDAIGNNVITGESFTALNATKVSLAHGFIQTGTLTIDNSTTTLGLGNFTIDYDAGTVILLDNAYNNTALTANYTWGLAEVRTSVKNGIISGFETLETTGDYLPIVVLAVIITLVMALILSMGGGMGGARQTAL